jgi:protein-tyrosine-phosphatase
VQYAFTIRQLGRILGGAEFPISTSGEADQRLADLRAYTIRNRGLRPIEDRVTDDIVDPYGRSLEVHTEAIAQLAPAIDLLSRSLGGRPVAWPD